MKAQILVTVEIDPDAERRCTLPPRGLAVSPAALMEEFNGQLRAWAHANPYNLRNPDHLEVRLELKPTESDGRPSEAVGPKLARDLDNIIHDLTTLSRLARMTANAPHE